TVGTVTHAARTRRRRDPSLPARPVARPSAGFLNMSGGGVMPVGNTRLRISRSKSGPPSLEPPRQRSLAAHPWPRRRSSIGTAAPPAPAGSPTTPASFRSAAVYVHVGREGPPPWEGRGCVGHHLPHTRLLLGARERLFHVWLRERRRSGGRARRHPPSTRRRPAKTRGPAAGQSVHVGELLRRPRSVAGGPRHDHRRTGRRVRRGHRGNPFPPVAGGAGRTRNAPRRRTRDRPWPRIDERSRPPICGQQDVVPQGARPRVAGRARGRGDGQDVPADQAAFPHGAGGNRGRRTIRTRSRPVQRHSLLQSGERPEPDHRRSTVPPRGV